MTDPIREASDLLARMISEGNATAPYTEEERKEAMWSRLAAAVIKEAAAWVSAQNELETARPNWTSEQLEAVQLGHARTEAALLELDKLC